MVYPLPEETRVISSTAPFLIEATAVACIPHAVPGAAIVIVGGLVYPEPPFVNLTFETYW